MDNQGEQASGGDDRQRKRRRWNESFHRYRFVVIVLSGAAYGMMKLLRFNISMAIVSMVNQTEVYLREHPDKTVDDFLALGYEPGGEFNWSYEVQNMIMSWYMIPYTVIQVATTKVAILMGCRLAVPVFLSICVLATLLTPASAYWGWQWVVAMRMLDGLGASVVMPLMVNIIETWMPYGDISLGLTVAHSTQAIFSTLGPISLGYLISIHWSWAFYGPGLITLVFAIVWFVFVADNPDKSFFTSSQEVELIGSSCKGDNTTINGCATKATAQGEDQRFTFLDFQRTGEFVVANSPATLDSTTRLPWGDPRSPCYRI